MKSFNFFFSPSFKLSARGKHSASFALLLAPKIIIMKVEISDYQDDPRFRILIN